MATRSLRLPFSGFFNLFARGAAQGRAEVHIAPHPEDALLIPTPKIGSKNYTEERLRADTGKYYQHVGRHMFR